MAYLLTILAVQPDTQITVIPWQKYYHKCIQYIYSTVTLYCSKWQSGFMENEQCVHAAHNYWHTTWRIIIENSSHITYLRWQKQNCFLLSLLNITVAFFFSRLCHFFFHLFLSQDSNPFFSLIFLSLDLTISFPLSHARSSTVSFSSHPS